MTGPVGYWHVDDIEEGLKLLLDAGAEALQAITDVGGGKLIASVNDADGNVIGLIQSRRLPLVTPRTAGSVGRVPGGRLRGRAVAGRRTPVPSLWPEETWA